MKFIAMESPKPLENIGGQRLNQHCLVFKYLEDDKFPLKCSTNLGNIHYCTKFLKWKKYIIIRLLIFFLAIFTCPAD